MDLLLIIPFLGKTIIHNKTNIIDFIDIDSRVKLKQYREDFMKTNYTKKPTDIIIFTDSYAYSSTSIFIKSFQNVGGAITVGFNGNPKLGKELFDASQSPSPATDLPNNQEYKNLKELGIEITSITFGETFEEDYKSEKPIPREYKLNPVDEISNIYEPYTDDSYQTFMDTANAIFDNYTNGQCNPNNTLLVLENDSCTFDEEFAHGGNPCGEDGKWNLDVCQKSYCDIGYYYNKTGNRCEIDYVTDDPNVKQIILNDEYSDTIIIDDNKEYILRVETNKYVYFFQASEPGYMQYAIDIPCPSSFCVLQKDVGNHYNKIYLNHYKNATDKSISFNITSVPNKNGYFQSLIAKTFIIESIISIPDKITAIIESAEEYIYYFKVLC